jgi:hypothetical protein
MEESGAFAPNLSCMEIDAEAEAAFKAGQRKMSWMAAPARRAAKIRLRAAAVRLCMGKKRLLRRLAPYRSPL